MADAEDGLVAAVTNRCMTDVPTWSTQGLGSGGQNGLRRCRLECVAWVMAVSTAFVAGQAEVKVLAILAGDEVVFREY